MSRLTVFRTDLRKTLPSILLIERAVVWTLRRDSSAGRGIRSRFDSDLSKMRWIESSEEQALVRQLVPAPLLELSDWKAVHNSGREFRCDFSNSFFYRPYAFEMFGDFMRFCDERKCYVIPLGKEEILRASIRGRAFEITDVDTVLNSKGISETGVSCDNFAIIPNDSIYFGVFPESGNWFCVSGFLEERAVFCSDQQFEYNVFSSVFWPDWVRTMERIASRGA